MPRKTTNRIGGHRWKAVLALTGGFGSGKSTVLKLLKQKGAFVLDADRIVHQTFSWDHKVRKRIKKVFGTINRAELSEIVFKSAKARRTLEKILHPVVRKKMFRELNRSKGWVAICDVPLLYEAGWKAKFDGVIVVNAPLAQRKKWLRIRGFSAANIQQRLRAQWPLAKKVKRADFVIQNNGSKNKLKQRVDKFWNAFKSNQI